MKKSTQLTTIAILLLLMINLVPPMFRNNELYFDNAYFTTLYLALSYIAIVIPFICNTNKFMRVVSFGVGGWFVAALIFELINWFDPVYVLNSSADDTLFNKVIICGTVGLAFYITFQSWKRQRHLDN